MSLGQLIINALISYFAGVASALFVQELFSIRTIGAVSFLSLSFAIIYFVQKRDMSLAGIKGISKAEPIKLMRLIEKAKHSVKIIGTSMHTLFEESESFRRILEKKAKECEIEIIFLDPKADRIVNVIDRNDNEPSGTTKRDIEMHLKKVENIGNLTIRLHQSNLRWGAVIVDDSKALVQPFIPPFKKTIYLNLLKKRFSILYIFLDQYNEIKNSSSMAAKTAFTPIQKE